MERVYRYYETALTECTWIFLLGKLPPPPMNIPPMKAPPFENYPPSRHTKNLPPRKLTPMKSLRLRKLPPSHEIPSPLINHTNERKNKITKFLAFRKVVQRNILIKITKVFFDTQMISQKILGLDTFFTEWKNSQVAFTCQLYKSRRTKTRQSNYKIWQICETTK